MRISFSFFCYFSFNNLVNAPYWWRSMIEKRYEWICIFIIFINFFIIKSNFSVSFMLYCLSHENSGVWRVLFLLLLSSSDHIVSAPPLLFDPNYFTGSFSFSLLRTGTHWIARAQWQRLLNLSLHYHNVTVDLQHVLLLIN